MSGLPPRIGALPGRALFTCTALLLSLGAYLRLNQLYAQILLDDEWHAVHQLLSGKTPAELFLTLGHADYSIPLGLLYWLESQWFGLSELGMRWPMVAISLLMLVLSTRCIWRQFSAWIALIYAFFLAVSPMLIIYSHTARPYALTLFFSYFGLYAFYRFLHDTGRSTPWAVCYCLCAAISIWLHPITGPFVVSPFLLEAAKALLAGRWRDIIPLTLLAIPAGALVLLLLLPPLMADPGALAGKAGIGAVSWDTFLGVWFMWLGTASSMCVVGLVALALVGLPKLLRAWPLAQSALLGLLLTAIAILLTEPAWVNHSLTFGRYLLPAIPLLSLAIAVGCRQIFDWVGRGGRLPQLLVVFLGGVFCIFYLLQSPVWELVQRPNSNANHSRFQFSFRAEQNKIIDYQKTVPLSPFWTMLGEHPTNSLRVAVAPFYFETYNWDGPRWESTSGQRVLPAYLLDYCVKRRWGEVPANDRYRFRVAHYAADLVVGADTQVDWLVYTKPFRGNVNGKKYGSVGGDTRHCLRQLRKDLGPPEYRDKYLIAYNLKARQKD